MVDTVRTWPYMLASQWQDGRAAGSDTPAQVRDLIVSIPVGLGFGAHTALEFPSVLRGILSLAQYPGITIGAGQTLAVRQANATAIQAASDLAAVSGYTLAIQPGVYEFDNAAGILWTDTTKYGGFAVRGTQLSQFIQFHANAPILTIGDVSTNAALELANITVDGLFLDYGVSQIGNALAVTLTLGRVWRSSFSSLQIGTGTNKPWIALRMWTADATNQFFFSNSMRDINIQGSQNRLFSFESSGTGNVFSNIYMNNASAGNVAGAITLPFHLGAGNGIAENSFHQCNVEWCSANIMMDFNQGNATFTSFHMEGCVLTGAGPFVMTIQGGSRVQFIGSTWLNLGINTGNFTGSARFAEFWDESNLNLIDPWLVMSTPVVALNAAFQLFFQDSGNVPLYARAQISVTNALIAGLDGFFSIEPRLPLATYGNITKFSGYSNSVVFPATKTVMVSNAVNNLVVYGSIGSEVVMQYTAAIGGALTIALSDRMMGGTDKGNTIKRPSGHQVMVVRDAGATGAFSLVIKNLTVAGTTIGTLTAASTSATFGFDGANWTAI